MATPLTDAINALTAYANGITGKSDTTLPDSVRSLASGYGQGGGDTIWNQIVDGTITEIDDKDGLIVNVNQYAFYRCYQLAYVNLPNVKTIGQRAFYECKKIVSIDLPQSLEEIGISAFQYCSSLEEVKLRKADGIVILGNQSVFASTPIKSGQGYIYVPSELIESYKSDTNWSAYVNMLRPLAD